MDFPRNLKSKLLGHRRRVEAGKGAGMIIYSSLFQKGVSVPPAQASFTVHAERCVRPAHDTDSVERNDCTLKVLGPKNCKFFHVGSPSIFTGQTLVTCHFLNQLLMYCNQDILAGPGTPFYKSCIGGVACKKRKENYTTAHRSLFFWIPTARVI